MTSVKQLPSRFPLPIAARALAGLLLLGSWAALAPAAPRTVPVSTPTAAVLDKAEPESVADLKAIQAQVKKVLKKVLPCTVGVRVGGAQGSGVIVSSDGYVLTAGHVSGKPGRPVTIILPNGRMVKGKTLGRNETMDSGLIKITEEGDWPYVEMGHSSELRKGQWCIAAGHPGGYQPGRPPVVRVGRILEVYKSFIRTDCALVGGDSGGPVFDMEGRVIGIHSCIGKRMTANIHVPVDTYRQTWDRLAKGESWGSRPGSQAARGNKGQAYLGVEADPNGEDCKITKVVPGSPADLAGVQVGDVVTHLDDQNVSSIGDLADQVQKKKPGDKVVLKIRRDGRFLLLEVELGRREE